VLLLLFPIHRCCAGALAGVLAIGLGACGSVKQDSPGDAAADAKQLRSCVAVPSITPVESAEPGYGNSCIHGVWTLQAFNGTTMPAVGVNNIVDVAPTPMASAPMANPLHDSTFAVHVSGSGQANVPPASTFAQLTASLNTLSITDVGTVDASAYTGIRFDAMLTAGMAGARLTVGTVYTDPAGGMCDPNGHAGTTDGEGTICFDNPGAQLTVSGMVWTRYEVAFASLHQLGFGRHCPTGAEFPRAAITHLKWDIGIPMSGPTPPWDLWVDNVEFY
jgi:hypothetical protein